MRAPNPDPLAWADHLDSVAGFGISPSQGPDLPGDPPPSLLRSSRLGETPERSLWATAGRGAMPGTGLLDLTAGGSLWARDRWSAIEVWTEAELCGLHALARLRRLDSIGAPAIAMRLRSAIRWHLEHTQPDNATHRPWAIHLFLGHPDPEVDLYGQTLLHNFEAAGRGDRDAAWILRDAAREIRLDPAVATRW